jgi:sigma-B regulation protein RsbU (phosphoserine phosphatase)
MYASPKDILIHVNRRLYHGIERNSFITMIIALFDTEKKEVVICRAGHNKALIATNGTLSYLDAPGIGLGLEPGTIFERELEEIHRPLKEHGLFVFYSDGLTEAMNEQKSQFGEDAVFNLVQSKRSLPARDLRTSLIEEVRQFQGTAEQHDDMTLVVVKVGKG